MMQSRIAKPMIVAGVMSGTSADGADVVLVRITPARESTATAKPQVQGTQPQVIKPKLKLLGHVAFPYPKKLRAAVLAAMDAAAISTADLARLHWRLGEFYGDAIVSAQQQLNARAALSGVHGQTIYHQGSSTKFLGEPLRCTWQIGEASEVAVRTGLPTVSDFRPSDMAVGGQGAPLVSMFDHVFFGHATRNRVLQNLGGIANMTAIPAGSTEVIAFDSGPASCVIDGCMQALYGRAYDRGGATAKRGQVVHRVLESELRRPYFSLEPPKSCGREEFAGLFVTRFIANCRAHGAQDADIIASATAFTAESIVHAYRTFVWRFLGQRAPLASATDYIVAGGGANNSILMKRLSEGLEPLGVTIARSETFGVPAQAKEAMAFALLAWLRWNGIAGNVPAATGSSRAVMLGKVTLP